MIIMQRALFFLLMTLVYANQVQAEDYNLCCGQDKIFTSCNFHNCWFGDDPSNPLPWPAQRVAEANDNMASVSMNAVPGEAGVAWAQVGVSFNLEGFEDWELVKHLPVEVTLDFSYNIGAFWEDYTGSGNAWIHLPPTFPTTFPNSQYDLLGYETGEKGSRGNHVIYKRNTTLEELQTSLGHTIAVIAACQAHSSQYWTANNHSFATITLNSVSVDFTDEKSKEFMLTFDDGPVPGNTENIVNALKNIYVGCEPVKAGFFMVGVGCCEDSQCFCPWYDRWPPKGSVRANHALVQMVANAGHYIGVHTQHHPDFDPWFKHWSVEDIKGEISGCYNEIKQALNPIDPNAVEIRKIFRPPYFCNTSDVHKAAEGFQIILGAGENEDAAVDVGGRQWTKARRLIQSWNRDYPCVLTFHDIMPGTAENIAEIIRYLQKEGFTLVHFDPSRLPGSPPSLIHQDTNTIHQSETVTHTVSLDSTVSTATFNVSWGGSDLDLVLYKPDGTKIDPNSDLVDPNVKYAERDTYEYYTISDPNPGNWIMEVSGVNVPPEGEKYAIRVEADTNLVLFAFTDKPDYELNELINVKANLVNDENSVTGASVTAKVQCPDGSIDNLDLYDDGTHGDEDPNDGFYANTYNNTSLRGSYEITVSAIGELTGGQYERASSLTVMVGSIIYGNVDFGAYAVFADHWLDQNCAEPNWCDTADLDESGKVDIYDLGILVEHWLEGTTP